jgi:hypothetical protein
MKRGVPYLLVALSLVPLLGGIARLVRLTSSDTPALADERFALAPVPAIIHILCAVAYSIVGALPLLRAQRPALWLHGHTHASVDCTVGETRIVCNPFGYVPDELNAEFRDRLLIEL